MHHRKAGRKLNRNSSHRIAMFRNMSVSLFQNELIKTTLPKAKELRRVAEPLITLAKTDTVSNRRLAFSRLRNKEAVSKLFNELGPRFKNITGGYLRVLKNGFRHGDSAPMAVVQLVEGLGAGENLSGKDTKPVIQEQEANTEAVVEEVIEENSKDGVQEDSAVAENSETETTEVTEETKKE